MSLVNASEHSPRRVTVGPSHANDRCRKDVRDRSGTRRVASGATNFNAMPWHPDRRWHRSCARCRQRASCATGNAPEVAVGIDHTTGKRRVAQLAVASLVVVLHRDSRFDGHVPNLLQIVDIGHEGAPFLLDTDNASGSGLTKTKPRKISRRTSERRIAWQPNPGTFSFPVSRFRGRGRSGTQLFLPDRSSRVRIRPHLSRPTSARRSPRVFPVRIRGRPVIRFARRSAPAQGYRDQCTSGPPAHAADRRVQGIPFRINLLSLAPDCTRLPRIRQAGSPGPAAPPQATVIPHRLDPFSRSRGPGECWVERID